MQFTAAGIAEQGTIAAMRLMRSELPKRLESWTAAVIEAGVGCDLLTGGLGGMATGLVAAEKLRLSWVPAHLQPLGRATTLYPGALFPNVPRWLGAAGRVASHRLTEAAAWMPFRAAMANARRKIALAGRMNPTAGQPILYGFSRHVVPLPEDDKHRVTGYWRMPLVAVPALPDRLAAFLDHPGLVVSIGFGSMGSANPAELARVAIAAARRAGVRMVILGGAGLRAEAAEDVFVANEVSHDRLFPLVDAIVHHGGAGTTGAAFVAGKPQVVVPFAVDQPFWASRVVERQCGPQPIRRRDLDEGRLADKISASLNEPTFKHNAKNVAMALSDERGADRAASVFDRL